MGHPLRWYLPGVVYEVTSRTIQELMLIRPTPRSRAIIHGVLSRALVLFPEVFLHAFTYLSNHFHLLASTHDGAQLAAFLGYVNGNVAREMGRLHGWKGPFWARRPRVIPIVDDDAIIARLRYVMANGVKEGLVATPLDWPGASSTSGLVGDMTVDGIRLRRDARAGAGDATEEAVVVPLTPIPPWAHLPHPELVERHQALVASIAADAAASPVGASALAAQDPRARPADPARSPAPACHASTPQARAWFRAAYRGFVDGFRRAAQAIATGAVNVAHPFPPGSFPRPSWYVAPPLTGQPWIPPAVGWRPANLVFS